MALFVNGEWFNPALEENSQPSQHKRHKQDYDAFVEETKHFKFPVTLKVKRANKIRTDSKGTPLPPPSDNLSWKSTIQTPYGSETWIYQLAVPEKKDGEYVLNRKLGEWVRGSLIIHKSQMDKLFYFMKKSGALRRILFHYDPAAEAGRKVAQREMEAELYFLIYNKDSELVRDPNRMRDVAKSWGVRNVDSLELSEIKTDLFEKVISGDDRRSRGVKAFMDAVKNKGAVSRQAKIQEAVEKRVIVFNDTDMAWKFVADGNETADICKLDTADRGREREALIEYLSRNAMEENRILYALRTGRLSEFTAKDVDTMSWSEMIQECKIAGIRTTGVNKEKVKDDLRDWLRQLKAVK